MSLVLFPLLVLTSHHFASKFKFLILRIAGALLNPLLQFVNIFEDSWIYPLQFSLVFRKKNRVLPSTFLGQDQIWFKLKIFFYFIILPIIYKKFSNQDLGIIDQRHSGIFYGRYFDYCVRFHDKRF